MSLGNLGVAVGAAVQGFQTQQRQNLAQDEAVASRNLREREMKMREEDYASKKAERDDQQALRQEIADLWKGTYGTEREVQDGEVDQATPDGTVVKVPVMKKAKLKVGDDPKTDMEYERNVFGAIAKRGRATPEQMKAHIEDIDARRRTPPGQALEKIILGDASAGAELATLLGKDPAKVKVDYKTKTIDFGDGSPPMDMRRALAKLGTADQYRRMVGMDKDEQQTRVGNLNIENVEGEISERKAMLPGKLAGQAATTNLANASASRQRAAATNSGARGAADPKALQQMERVFSSDPNYKSLSEIDKNTIQTAAEKRLADGVSPQMAAKEATAWYSRQLQAAAQHIKTAGLKDANGKPLRPADLVASKMGASRTAAPAATDEE